MNITLPHRIKNDLGEELIFHRMENEDGEEKLIVECYVEPNAGPIMHTHHKQDESFTVVVFYLTALFNAQKESGKEIPEPFDAAYLLYRYRKEYGMPGLPRFVNAVIIPATYTIGKLRGRYKKFEQAPEPM